MKSGLPLFRDVLAALVGEMAVSGDANSTEIFERFLLKHRDLVDENAEALVRIAVIKLISDVSRRKPPSALTNIQGDLFDNYGGPGVLVVARGGPKARQRKIMLDMTKEELRCWLKERKRFRSSETRQYNEVDRMYRALQPYGTPDTTIRDALLLQEEDRRENG